MLNDRSGDPDRIGDTTARPATSSGGASSGEVRALVGRACHGDEQAWEVLFRRSYPRLLAYAMRRLPTKELAKDAVGEAMIRAVAHIDRLRHDGGGFDAWMYGILRHVVIDAQRGLSRERPGLVPDFADDRTGPADWALAREDAEEVSAAFQRLRRSDQELLELRVVAGLSADEVAAVLGRRPGAIRMAQSRALGRLRVLLSGSEAAGRASA